MDRRAFHSFDFCMCVCFMLTSRKRSSMASPFPFQTHILNIPGRFTVILSASSKTYPHFPKCSSPHPLKQRVNDSYMNKIRALISSQPYKTLILLFDTVQMVYFSSLEETKAKQKLPSVRRKMVHL